MPWKHCSVVEEREKLVLAILSRRESVRVICRRFGVSRQVAYKYVSRFRQEGKIGLRDRTRGPKSKNGRRWTHYRRLLFAERRRRPTRGARMLRWWLRQRQPHCPLPSERTVERWLHAAGLVRVRQRRRVIAPTPLQPVRCGRRSNEVWTFDWKGWCRTGDGAKIEPLTIRDLGSRYVLWAYPLRQRSDQAVRRVCRRLFLRYGRPKAIRTDLGGPFCSTGAHGLTTLSLWWYRQGIGVEFVRRRAGVDNNAHEQMHGVLERETASPPAATRQAQLQRLRRWKYEYNHERPHAAIGNRPPAQRYRPQPAALTALLLPAYAAHWLVRTVTAIGEICFEGKRHYIGRTFAGLPVGCKPSVKSYRVYFDQLLLRTLPRRVCTDPVRPRQT